MGGEGVEMSVVSLRDTLAAKEKGLPEYVHKLLKFWGAWMRGIHIPQLEDREAFYPKENTISKLKNLRDGAAQLGADPNIATLSDSIGLAVDRAVEDLSAQDRDGYAMAHALVLRYYRGLSGRIACKRLHVSEDRFDDLVKMAKCYMMAKLEPWKDMVE